jgi:2-keto-4-pentenoate hydratase/2-oxohepta-3-ene-1,7-dioic acid hydratase in catechol pathway
MKYLTFSLPTDAHPRLGVLHKVQIIDVGSIAAPSGTSPLPSSLLELIQGGPERWRQVAEVVSAARGVTLHETGGIRWHPPIPRPTKNVVCVGLNYLSHAKESAAAQGRELKLPEVPLFFTKAPLTVNGPFDPIPWDRSATREVDWEVELGVIIGRRGRNIRQADALDHVFGYTVVNDVSARDLQRQHGQFFKGKSLDGFCPMGPVVVTADEFGDPQTKSLALRVNGTPKQQGQTSDMIFPVAALIDWLSRGLTVEAGDILATGTPHGVGFARTPPEFLQDGDVVEAEVEGIGAIRNTVAAHS